MSFELVLKGKQGFFSVKKSGGGMQPMQSHRSVIKHSLSRSEGKSKCGCGIKEGKGK